MPGTATNSNAIPEEVAAPSAIARFPGAQSPQSPWRTSAAMRRVTLRVRGSMRTSCLPSFATTHTEPSPIAIRSGAGTSTDSVPEVGSIRLTLSASCRATHTAPSPTAMPRGEPETAIAPCGVGGSPPVRSTTARATSATPASPAARTGVRRHGRRGPAARPPGGGDGAGTSAAGAGAARGAKGVGGVRRRGRSLRPERRPGSLRHARDVLGGHSLERDTRGECAAGIGARHQVGELRDGALADPRPGALEQRDQVLRQRRRLDHGAARALGDQHVALRAVGPQRRVLAAVPAPHLPVRVVVELADRHEPVAVAVGVAAAQAVDEHAREHGGDAVAVDLAALEGVLGPARGGQDDPAATLEALAQRQPALALGALRERPAVAAVEHEDLAPAAAVLELEVLE